VRSSSRRNGSSHLKVLALLLLGLMTFMASSSPRRVPDVAYTGTNARLRPA
jgi:hypothetical protein